MELSRNEDFDGFMIHICAYAELSLEGGMCPQSPSCRNETRPLGLMANHVILA